MCDRCEELEAEIAYLKGELGLSMEVTRIAKIEDKLGIRSGWANMLMALFLAKDRVVTKAQLVDAVPANDDISDRNIKIADVYICMIRRKIGFDTIETVWNRGYRLSAIGRAVVADALGETA